MVKSVVQRIVRAKMRAMAPERPSDISSGPQPKRFLRICLSSSATSSAGVATAICVMSFLSTVINLEVSGFVMAWRMSGGFWPLWRPGVASMSAFDTWYK